MNLHNSFKGCLSFVISSLVFYVASAFISKLDDTEFSWLAWVALLFAIVAVVAINNAFSKGL